MRRRISRLAYCLILSLVAGSAQPGLARGADLATVYTRALSSDPEYLEATARILGAREGVVQARQELMFESGVSGYQSYGWEHRDDREGVGYGYEIVLRQPVFHWDDWLSLRQARFEESRERASLNAALQDLMLRVASAYFDVLRAEDRLIFREGSRGMSQEQLVNATERFESGLITIEDVEDVRSRLDIAAAEVLGAAIEHRNAFEALRQITGVPYETLSRLEEEVPLLRPTPPELAPWLDSATQQNMMVIAARHEEEAAFTEIRVQNAEGYLPTFDVIGTNGYERNSHLNQRDRKIYDTQVRVQVDVPLDFIGRTRSLKRGAQARVEESRQKRRREERLARRLVREAFRSVVEGIPHIEAARKAIVSANKAQAAMEEAYFQGTRLSFEVINSKNRALLAIQSYNAFRYDYLIDGLKLKQGAGTLTEADLSRINQWLVGSDDGAAPAGAAPGPEPVPERTQEP